MNVRTALITGFRLSPGSSPGSAGMTARICWREGALGEPLLVVSGLCAGYAGREILHDVDLSVGQGELVAVLGSHGAGKSTLNRAISGVLRPARGTNCVVGAS